MSDQRSCEPWADAMGLDVPMTALLLKKSDVMRIIRALSRADPDLEEYLEWVELAHDLAQKFGNDPSLCSGTSGAAAE